MTTFEIPELPGYRLYHERRGPWRLVRVVGSDFVLAHDGSQAAAIERARSACRANPESAVRLIESKRTPA